MGGGNFGEVFLAIWKQTTKIAVKRLNSDDQSNFKKELAILKKLSHPNIITFYGIFKDNESIYLAMEFMELGNLLNYLQFKRTDLKLIDLIRMAKDCAGLLELFIIITFQFSNYSIKFNLAGMEYLSCNNNFI